MLVAARQHGIRDLAEVDLAVLEADGAFSFFKRTNGDCDEGTEGKPRQAPMASNRSHVAAGQLFEKAQVLDGSSLRHRAEEADLLSTEQYEPRGSIIAFDDLEHTEHSHEFVGAEHDGVPFCFILVHAGPGVGPKLHRHPYPEVFVLQDGQATFRIGDRTVEVEAGQVVVSPPGEAHGFVNTGTGELCLIAIHGAGRFATEWLSGPDPVWSSQRT
ncbi:MAG: cupin domain-containing protein [Jiangellaceae bacterium]|nr:cupin domain-containing protein [Jiangellaceae bacterium]